MGHEINITSTLKSKSRCGKSNFQRLLTFQAAVTIALLTSNPIDARSETGQPPPNQSNKYNESSSSTIVGEKSRSAVEKFEVTVAQLDEQTLGEGKNSDNTVLIRNSARLRQAIDDMTKAHEEAPLGGPKTGWGVAPLVVMGTDATQRSIPKNWDGVRYPEWKAVLPWFVVFEGNNGGENSSAAVEIGGIELWQLSGTNYQWKLLNSADSPTWVGSYNQDAVGKSTERAFVAGKRPSSIVAPGKSSVVHGGLGQVALPWNDTKGNADLAALLVVVKHRLVVRGTANASDLTRANLLVQAGADYYPEIGTSLKELGAKYVPGAGLGQLKRATNDWRYSTMLVTDPKIAIEKITTSPPPEFKY